MDKTLYFKESDKVMKVLDYKVIIESDSFRLTEAVLVYTNKDWDLAGGVSSYRHDEYHNANLYDSYPMYSQAIVLREVGLKEPSTTSPGVPIDATLEEWLMAIEAYTDLRVAYECLEESTTIQGVGGPELRHCFEEEMERRSLLKKQLTKEVTNERFRYYPLSP